MNVTELAEITSKLDKLVGKCVSGEISFDVFLKEYGYPIGEYALDGHECNEDKKVLLSKFSSSLKPHIEITEFILNKLCSSEQAKEKAYIEAGRIGSDKGLLLLKEVAAKNGLYQAT